MAAEGRVHAVTTGCFQALHLQRLVCGGEPGAGSGMYRPIAGTRRLANRTSPDSLLDELTDAT